MNSLKNRVQLIGNLGQDPEMKTLESGKKVAHFTLATNDGYKNADGQNLFSIETTSLSTGIYVLTLIGIKNEFFETIFIKN